jgi:acetyltransferase-like isoleucine patch superfamily enzyme
MELTMSKWKSHGAGLDYLSKLAWLGKNVIIEDGVRIFFPERVEIGDDVYIGHNTVLKGYFDKRLIIGSGTWIGPQCFMYAAGGISIGQNVGVGPGVVILTSAHKDPVNDEPILHQPIDFSPVHLDDGCDIGARTTILKGVRIGKGVQIGAGAVVTKDIPDRAIAAGIPAKILRFREVKTEYAQR